MPVIGVNFTSITASNKRKAVKGKISVSSRPEIKSVEYREITSPKLENILAIGFSFVTSYEPDLGKIEINGELLYQHPEAKELEKKWKKEKELPPEVTVEILNFVLRRCLVKAVALADDLQLPPPLNLPVLRRR